MKRTINEIISYFDAQCPNQFEQETKVKWLSQCDEQIFNEIIKPRENAPAEEFIGYTAETPLETQLLVPEPFAEIYRYWLQKSVDYTTRDINAYNNSLLMYQQYYKNFLDYYNRNHRWSDRSVFKI